MSFNQDHTPIWEDARALSVCYIRFTVFSDHSSGILQEHFRLLMSDLPAPYTLPEYTRPTNGKIRIKPPVAPSSTHPHIDQPLTDQPASFTLRVPANIANYTKASPTATPVVAAVSLPAASTSTPPAANSSALPPTQSKQPSFTAAVQPTAPNFPLSHYPNASYIPPVPGTVAPAASSSGLPTNSLAWTYSSSSSPAPSLLHPSHQLKSVLLKTEPRGHLFPLDYRDGVKTWSMRLRSGETGVHVSQVAFLGDEEEESSGEDEDQEVEEQEEEEHMDVDVPVKNGRRKGKGKGRNRAKATTKVAIAKTRNLPAKKKKQKIGQLQLKLNGTVVKDEEEDGNWTVQLSVGSNIVEVGETGGLIWKIYIDRLNEV
jgi:chromatin structure-remodeling complex subunit RSC4